MPQSGDSRFSVQLDSTPGLSPQVNSRRPDPGSPFRIAVFGDFSGRASRPGSARRDVADLRPMLVDRDNFDDILARLAPELHVGEGDESLVLQVRELEDFHPDRLFERLPFMRAFRDLRERLEDSRTAGAALREVLGDAPTPAPAAGGVAGAQPSGSAVLEDILFATSGPESSVPAAPPPRERQEDDLQRFVKAALVGHVLPGEDPRRTEVLASLDAAVGDRIRAILHDPAFQQVEALWRGLYFLLRRLETGGELKVILVDVTRDELEADVLGDEPLERSGLYRLLVDETIGSVATWGLIVGCYTFGPAAADAALLSRLAAVARAAGAPWISAATAQLAGWASYETRPLPEEWASSQGREWQQLRSAPQAQWAGLVTPGFMLRLPYGAEGEPCDAFEFEELGSRPAHEDFLWGNPALAAALLLGESYTRSGWSLRPGERADIGGLPLYLLRRDGESVAVPCGETLLSEGAAAKMIEAGLMPLATMKDSDAVRLVHFQSIAAGGRALAGGWRPAGS